MPRPSIAPRWPPSWRNCRGDGREQASSNPGHGTGARPWRSADAPDVRPQRHDGSRQVLQGGANRIGVGKHDEGLRYSKEPITVYPADWVGDVRDEFLATR